MGTVSAHLAPSRLLLRYAFCLSASLGGLGTVTLASCAREPYGPPDARPPTQAARPLPADADSVRGTVANPRYAQHNSFYQIILGRHYRQICAAPVAVAVFDPARWGPGWRTAAAAQDRRRLPDHQLKPARPERPRIRAADPR